MASILPVFRRSMRESWRSLLGWTIGIAGVLFLYLPLYPSIGASDQMKQLIDSLPEQLVDTLGYNQITSGAGYTEATFYGLMGFLLLTIAAVMWGSSLAAAEESGRAELDLAHGIGRGSYALETALSVLVRLLWLGVFAGLVIWAVNGRAPGWSGWPSSRHPRRCSPEPSPGAACGRPGSAPASPSSDTSCRRSPSSPATSSG